MENVKFNIEMAIRKDIRVGENLVIKSLDFYLRYRLSKNLKRIIVSQIRWGTCNLIRREIKSHYGII